MQYAQPAKLADGRYFLKVTKEDGGRVMHQVNGLKLTIGDGGEVNLVVPGDMTLFSEIDEHILTQAKESKVNWFGKEISDDTVVAAYQKSVNPENELSASLATIKGQVVTTVYDTQKNQVEIGSLSGTVTVDTWLELTGLVFTKRAFEPVWKVIQVRIKGTPKARFPREYLFKDDPADEDEDDVDL